MTSWLADGHLLNAYSHGLSSAASVERKREQVNSGVSSSSKGTRSTDSTDRGAWQATVHGVTKNQTGLRD